MLGYERLGDEVTRSRVWCYEVCGQLRVTASRGLHGGGVRIPVGIAGWGIFGRRRKGM